MITRFKNLPVGAVFRTTDHLGRPHKRQMPLKKRDLFSAVHQSGPSIVVRLDRGDVCITEELMQALVLAYFAARGISEQTIDRVEREGKLPLQLRPGAREHNAQLKVLHEWLQDGDPLLQIPLPDEDDNG